MIKVVNVQEKAIDKIIKIGTWGSIVDYKLFGDQENQFVAISDDGSLGLINFDYTRKRANLEGKKKLDLIQEREEKLSSVGVCSKSKYLLIETRSDKIKKRVISRLLVMKVSKNSFMTLVVTDLFEDLQPKHRSIRCFKYFGQHFIWLALTDEKQGEIHLLDFNSKTPDLKFLKNDFLRWQHWEDYPSRLSFVDKWFYYTGACTKIMRFRSEIKN